jgi:soluble lytic murein transglycosylase-like protein
MIAHLAASFPNLLRHCKYAANLALLTVPLWGQSAQAPEDVLSKQRTAAAAMQQSLAKQRAAIQKQMGTSDAGTFFVLPRAANLGTITGTVAAPLSIVPPILPVGPECDPLPAPEVESLVGETAERDGLSADLLRSVMKQESGFRPCAVSSKGAMGLMQLMPATAEELGIMDPFDAASNLDGGARFLKQLLNRYGGDLPKALGAYNAGPSKVDAAGAVPVIPETLEYVRQIMAALPFH